MAAPIRRSDRTLSERLQSDATEFDFFQTVRLIHLETICNARDSGVELRVPTGTSQHPMLECLRFRAHVALTFPASELASLTIRGDNRESYPRKYEISTTFMGFVGALGVLPQHYTQMILRRRRENDEAFRNFLDLFHHRVISIYYRAWQKNRFAIRWEECRAQGENVGEDLFTQSLYSLVGFGNGMLRETQRLSSVIRGRLSFSDQLMLQYAGLLSHRPRNAVSLQRMLSAVFAIPMEVRQRQGQWVHLAPESQTRMPGAQTPLMLANCVLGDSAMAGEKIWSVESGIRIVAGPLNRRDFERFCPGKPDFRRLSQLVRLWVGPEFDLELQVILKAVEVPRTSLHNASPGGTLGWTTWIGNQPAVTDARDAVFRLLGEPDTA